MALARKKQSKWVGFLMGPVLVFFALSALWKNETRFDYHKAAEAAPHLSSHHEKIPGERFAFTDRMDLELTLSGEYVETFSGYLSVQRSAEIYAWERNEDSEGNVSWRKRWMSSVESNSRNGGITQQLSSAQFRPPEYQVGTLVVDANRIEFVDGSQGINPGSLDLNRQDLRSGGDYFYLYKRNSGSLGDERVSYSGIPVPYTATYFGLASAERGVADTSNMRTGFIHEIIQDSGVLHHIVAGERETALATMKSHIGRLKWIVRFAGTIAVVFGFVFLFSSLFGFLFNIPIIGRIAESGAFIVALVIGLPLALLTITASWLIAHPLILVGVVALVGGGIWSVRKKGNATQTAVRSELEQQFGNKLENLDLPELEFMELAQLALSDTRFGPREEKFLRRWARKKGWDDPKFDAMLSRARQQRGSGERVSSEEHLRNLVKLALADGTLTQGELDTIQRAARNLGYNRAKIVRLTRQVQQIAESRGATVAAATV